MVWIIIGSILLGLLLVTFILSIIGYKVVFYSPLKGQNNDFNKVKYANYNGISGKVNNQVNQILALSHEDLFIKSYDGLKLHAYLYKSQGSNEYVILFHGYRRTARRNFCGLALDLLQANKNVVLVDMRAHGESEGHLTTFGQKEQYDVVSWANYIRELYGDNAKIVVGGVSLGAAAVLMAADKLNKDVKIIADSPYFSIKDVFISIIHQYKLWTFYFYPLAIFVAHAYCHISLKSDVPSAISNSKCQILIIHSKTDKMVSYKISEKISMDNKNHVQLALFDNVEHGFAYLRQTEKFREVYLDYLNQ